MCGKKTLVAYIDEYGDRIEDGTGRCDREDKCGYMRLPDRPFEENIYTHHRRYERQYVKKKKYRFSFDEVLKSKQRVEESSLFKFLSVKTDKAKQVFESYHVGCWELDWTVFWQIDQNNEVRTGKLFKYGSDGKRSKTQNIRWVHALPENKNEEYELEQCLFGLHLVNSGKPIAVVESEKTAVIASMFIDNFTWMATGGKSITRTLDALKGKNVTLFPDLGAFDEWKKKADELGFNCSDYLERIATEEQKKEGLDIADFLI